MLVEYYFPQSLSPARLDRYLAGGWFRSGPSLFRAKVLCLEGRMYSVVNIRIQLEQYTYSKSLRKIMNRNQDRFRVEVGHATVDDAKERLYAFQKQRFKGFIFDSLDELLFSGNSPFVYDTREIRIYDDAKLVAASYFDQGQQSTASLLGLYDPAYSRYSLGIYTMLQEIRYATSQGHKYYYPGYVLKGYSGFDYKLRLGNVSYYNWQGRWRPFDRVADEQFIVPFLESKIREAETHLRINELPFTKQYYPFFSIGYLNMADEEFLRSPVYLLIATESLQDRTRYLVLEYVLEEDLYFLSWVTPDRDYLEIAHNDFSEGFFQEGVYAEGLLVRDQLLAWHQYPYKVIERIPYVWRVR